MRKEYIPWWHMSNIGGAAYCDEYQAVYDSFTTKPSAAVAAADNTMVSTLVDAGLWPTKLDVFDVLACETNDDGESLKNWISPGTYDPALVNAPTYVSLEGFTSNGTTSYINANWNPNTEGVKYTLDNCSIGAYIRTNVDDSGGADLGIDTPTDSSRISFFSRTAGKFAIRVNSSDVDLTLSSSDSRALWVIKRNNSTVMSIDKNGVTLKNASAASVSVPNEDLFICARNDGTGTAEAFGNKQISLVFAGTYLTEAESLIIYNAFQTRMTTLGKEV